MKPLRVYLDTSVINFLFANDVPELRKVTETFFEDYVRQGKYLVYISDVVIREIEKTPDEAKRRRLLEVVREYSLRVLMLDEAAIRMATIYVDESIIPSRKIEDAQHIALATCNQMDILLSWNFKHLANIQKQIAVKGVNEREGYFYPLTLTNPMEVLYEND